MSTVLKVFGPFSVGCEKKPIGSAKQVGKEHIKDFWNTEITRSYAAKQGCYVFAMKAGRGYTPWYVGKATKSFKQECFSGQNLGRYNKVLFKGQRGNPVIFLVAPSEKGKNKVKEQVINDMEKFLIQTARYANPEITEIQIHHTKLPQWSIKGVVRGGVGKRDATTKAFVKMMGF